MRNRCGAKFPHFRDVVVGWRSDYNSVLRLNWQEEALCRNFRE
jgi:hypothetical protein